MRGCLLILLSHMVLCSSAQAKDAVPGQYSQSPTCLVADAPPDISPPGGTQPIYVLATTTSTVEGYKIREYKGIVRGVMVRQPTVGQGLVANVERIVGGKLGAYLEMCDTGRQQAYDLCIDHARAMGANAVIGMAYDSTAFEHGDDLEVEMTCYGTAVVLERLPAAQ